MTQIFSYPIRIYWEDTDAGGVVYYANYLKFAERARTEWLRSLGFNQSDLDGAFVVKRCVIDYHAPARLDNLLVVTAELIDQGAASLKMRQHISKDDIVLADLEITLVFVSSAGRATRIPEDIRRKLDKL